MSAGVYGPGSLQTLQALSLPQALPTPPFPAETVMGHSQSQMLMMYLMQWRGRNGATRPPGPFTSVPCSPLDLIQLALWSRLSHSAYVPGAPKSALRPSTPTYLPPAPSIQLSSHSPRLLVHVLAPKLDTAVKSSHNTPAPTLRGEVLPIPERESTEAGDVFRDHGPGLT